MFSTRYCFKFRDYMSRNLLVTYVFKRFKTLPFRLHVGILNHTLYKCIYFIKKNANNVLKQMKFKANHYYRYLSLRGKNLEITWWENSWKLFFCSNGFITFSWVILSFTCYCIKYFIFLVKIAKYSHLPKKFHIFYKNNVDNLKKYNVFTHTCLSI